MTNTKSLSVNEIAVAENAKSIAARDVALTVRAKAFTGEGVREHRVRVSGETVRVWDSVAGHYTTLHALTPSAVRRIVRMAKSA